MTPKIPQIPKFEENTRPVLEEAIKVFTERGDQYGDTWRNCQFLVLKAVARQLGYEIKPEHCRALVTAGFVDMKYQRFEGGWKEDHCLDGINYQGFLVGEMRDAEIPQVLPTPIISDEELRRIAAEAAEAAADDVPF